MTRVESSNISSWPMRPFFWIASFFLIPCFATLSLAGPCSQQVKFGAAKADITGPVIGSAMNGYGELTQRSKGLHMRTFARAFTFQDPCTEKTVALVLTDLAMVHQNLREQILWRLESKLPGIFTFENLMLSATHTHSSFGGYSPHILYNIPSLGTSHKTFEGIVEGSVDAIVESYKRMQQARLSFTQRELKGVSWNRSIEAYLANPESERERYGSNVDTDFDQLNIHSLDGESLAVLNWFPVHPVSLPLSNRLISGDNKGLAAYFLEQNQENKNFVAGFFQANSGDVSPYPVDDLSQKMNQNDSWLGLEKSAKRQWEASQESLNISDGEDHVMGDQQIIDFRHVFIDFRQYIKNGWGGYIPDICSAALGVSFAAGTENGQPLKLFSEGTVYGENWPEITFMPKLQKCQAEKVILLPTGHLRLTANILPYQIVRLGSLVIVGTPFEMTTMAGRRLKEALMDVFEPLGVKKILLSGLSNEYAHYVTTPEEYRMQHYEGGSNLFGPNSLDAHTFIFRSLAEALREGRTVTGYPSPQLSKKDLLIDKESYLKTSDQAKKISDIPMQNQLSTSAVRVVEDLENSRSYNFGEVLEFKFLTFSPNRLGMRGNSFISIEFFEDGDWKTILTDNDHQTRLLWERRGENKFDMTLYWYTAKTGKPGLYRVCYQKFDEQKSTISSNLTDCDMQFSMN